MVIRAVCIVTCPCPVIFSVCLCDYNRFTEICKSCDLLQASFFDACHIIVQFSDCCWSVTECNIRCSVIICENRRINCLSHGYACISAHAYCQKRSPKICIWSCRVVCPCYSDCRCSVWIFSTIVEIIFIAFFLDGRCPCTSFYCPWWCSNLYAIFIYTWITVGKFHDNTFVCPVYHVLGRECMEYGSAPWRISVCGREDPEFTVKVINIRICILSWQNRVIADHRCLYCPFFIFSITCNGKCSVFWKIYGRSVYKVHTIQFQRICIYIHR